MTTIDVLVVGGGPVGLATALHLRDAGMRVEVLEPRADPIDKACGEGLMPSAVAALTALGVETDGAALRGIRYLAGLHRAEARFVGEPGRGIRRLALQSRMGAAAAERGIPVHAVAAERIRIAPDAVEVDGRRARYLVGADGLHSLVRRAAGLGRRSRGRSRFGLRRHYRLAPWTDLIEVQWARSAEAYVTPVADDEIGVAVLSSTRASFEDHLASFPALRARIADATPTSDVRGSGRLRQDVVAVGQGRVALVGDAAGYIDALTGEGLSIGLATASVLARCLVEDRLDDYPRAWARATRRSRALTHGLLAVSSVPPLRRAIVPVAERVPAVYGAVVRGLAG